MPKKAKPQFNGTDFIAREMAEKKTEKPEQDKGREQELEDYFKLHPISIAQKMAEKRAEMLEQDKGREQQREADSKLLIDPHFNYSPSLNDFMQEVRAYHPTKQGTEYMKFLRESKKWYSNSSAFYCTWGGSKINELRCDEHRKIVAFVSSELEREDIDGHPTVASSPIGQPDPTDPYFGLVEHFKKLLTDAEQKAEMGEGKAMKEWPLIRLAAFVEIMYDKKWFVSKYRIKATNALASARYGKNIEVQLGGTKKKERGIHKKLLNKYF